jgi:hypothetical protein
MFPFCLEVTGSMVVEVATAFVIGAGSLFHLFLGGR